MKLINLIRKVSREQRYKRLDIFVTISLLTLFLFSCLMVYSATMIGNKYGMFTNGVPVSSNYFIIRQFIWVSVSIISYFIFSSFIPYELLKNKAIYPIGFGIIFCLLIIPQFQSSINGAHSWISIGSFRFQPSPLAQIFIIAYMAMMLEGRKETLRRPASLQKISSMFAVPFIIILLIFFQNDTGTMVITILVLMTMVLCSNISFKNIMTIIKVSILGFLGALLVFLLKNSIVSSGASYKVNRLKTFIDPFAGSTSSDQHIVNSLISFGNGGLFGRGIGNSIQKLGYLPEAHTDFILSITAEELGFIGVIFLSSLLLIIIFRVLNTGIKSYRTFESMFAIGFAALLFIQTIINMGGVTASLPMTGVPIPYFSFGGSSMLILSTTLGIVMNLSSHIKYTKGGR